MARTLPDSNDIIVWKLNEQTGAYRNTGTQSPNSTTTDLNLTTAYSITQTSGASIDPGTTDIGNHADEAMTVVALPFNFTFYGTTYSSVNVSSNGFIEFGLATQAFNVTMPRADFGATIFGFTRDEDTSTAGFGIFTSTVGSAGSRIFNIEFRNRPFGQTSTLNYEIRLFENSQTFEVIYGNSTATSGFTGCAGIQSSAGTFATIFGNGINIPANGTKLTYSLNTTTVLRNGNGIFDSCPFIPGTGNFPNGSSAIRNYAQGANTIQPAFPMTVSAWVYVRSYNSSNNGSLIAKQYRDTNSTQTWTAPFYAINISMLTTTSGLSWICQFANSTSTQISIQIDDYPIPLSSWSHIGMTYDGTSLKAYLNGTQCIFYTGATQFNSVASSAAISYTDGVNGSGPWKIGAITATGSANKEEANYMIQDIRIANVARPLSYFQNVYKYGIQTITPTVQFVYKLQAFDLGCSTPTPVVWTDTQVSLANAPAPSCGGPYSTVEVIGSWIQTIPTLTT